MNNSDTSASDYDVVIVGSGFGGSVSALRLTEKGYKVLVVEAGRRFKDEEFAKNSWHLKDYLWAPKIGCFGIQRIELLHDSLVLAGAGVGGGSLVYANTLYEPLDPFYEDADWAHITDWKSELAPYYDQAKRMLGVETYTRMTAADEVIKKTAENLGYGDSFHFAPIGVLFDDNDPDGGTEVADPYFGGVGPSRKTCTHCGECMSGCRHNAKNTLVKNYLYLAEGAGAEVRALTTVVDVKQRAVGGYKVFTRPTGKNRGKNSVITTDQVIFSAASLGTQKLLHHLKDSGSLPNVSDRLGYLTRTNSEALMGSVAMRRDIDYTEGVAISSSVHPNETTHIEPVRYGKGSNLMMFVQMVLTSDGKNTPSLGRFLLNLLKVLPRLFKVYDYKHWSERTVIALVMQARDNSITTYTKKRLFGSRRRMTTKQGDGEPNPNFIPEAHQGVVEMARVMAPAEPGGIVTEPVGIPMTAHFLGGCAIGDSPETGVIDPYQRLYGYEGLHVIDGSAVSANLGVNPSLTITAQAERAVSFWPNRGELDPRPALGEAYRRIQPVAPKNPVVPDNAPAALRLPIVGIS